MILLLLFGLFAECVSLPFSSGTSPQPSDIAQFRRETMLLKPIETNSKLYDRAHHKPCYKVLCADGRCVSHSWLCRDTDVGSNDSSVASHVNNSDDLMKRQSLYYNCGMGVFAVMLIVIVVLVCICAIEDKEYAEHNFNFYKRTSNKYTYPYSRLENGFNCCCVSELPLSQSIPITSEPLPIPMPFNSGEFCGLSISKKV